MNAHGVELSTGERAILDRWLDGGARLPLPSGLLVNRPTDRARLSAWLSRDAEKRRAARAARGNVARPPLRQAAPKLAPRLPARVAAPSTKFRSDDERRAAMDDVLHERTRRSSHSGPRRKKFAWTDIERRAIAFHEAGHAVVAYCEGIEIRGAMLNTTGRGKFLGFVAMPGGHWSVVVEAAGPIAERIAVGELETRRDDFDRHESRIDKRAAQETGFEHGRADVRAAAYCEDAESEIREHWGAVRAVAAALIARGVLSGRQIVSILEGVLPPATVEAVEQSRAWDRKHGR